MRGHSKGRVQPKNGRRQFYPDGGYKKKYRCRQKERASMGNSLAEGAVHRNVVGGRVAVRTRRGLVDDGRYIMNVDLRNKGLQRKGDHNKPDGKAPSLSFSR